MKSLEKKDTVSGKLLVTIWMVWGVKKQKTEMTEKTEALVYTSFREILVTKDVSR